MEAHATMIDPTTMALICGIPRRINEIRPISPTTIDFVVGGELFYRTANWNGSQYHIPNEPCATGVARSEKDLPNIRGTRGRLEEVNRLVDGSLKNLPKLKEWRPENEVLKEWEDMKVEQLPRFKSTIERDDMTSFSFVLMAANGTPAITVNIRLNRVNLTVSATEARPRRSSEHILMDENGNVGQILSDLRALKNTSRIYAPIADILRRAQEGWDRMWEMHHAEQRLEERINAL